MIDLCFVGNSSIDLIKTENGSMETFGGSAIYSSLSCRSVSNKSIGIISNVNSDLKKILDSKQIYLFGKVVDEINTFEIDESLDYCKFIRQGNNDILINEDIEVNYLHVSFRKGVNIDNILNNSKIRYNHLSIDVMIHSIDSFIDMIEKYIDKIDIIFCNNQEYQVLKKHFNNLPLAIITNQNKPVIAVNKSENIYFNVPQNISTVSSTGAGDSFIGGFLAEYSKNRNLNSAINTGIVNASYSITKFGPIDISYRNNDTFKNGILPKNIIVVGNSCAGKTTFIEFFKSFYNIYTDIDDLAPLLEMFMIDDISNSKNIDEFINLKNKLVFMKDIYEHYLNDFPNIEHYSVIAKNGEGHDIINPDLWDIILKKSVEILKNENNIIQFSRGRDEEYEKKYGKDVYKRSLEIILQELDNRTSTIIINLVSNLKMRKQRNKNRYEQGGHFVSEDTMDNVYKDDIFQYERVEGSKGVINLSGVNYPVYTINNNRMLSPIELSKFLLHNVSEILKYYEKFKEEKIMNMKEIQKEIWQNKLNKGFNTTDVNKEFCLLYGEVAEAYDAYRKKKEDLNEELADIAIYLMGLSEMLGFDLEDEILKKVDKNGKRVYKNIDGVNVRVSD